MLAFEMVSICNSFHFTLLGAAAGSGPLCYLNRLYRLNLTDLSWRLLSNDYTSSSKDIPSNRAYPAAGMKIT